MGVCMVRGGHGLPKVSPGPAMPYPSMPCRWATPETACFRGGLLLLWTSHDVRLSIMVMACEIQKGFFVRKWLAKDKFNKVSKNDSKKKKLSEEEILGIKKQTILLGLVKWFVSLCQEFLPPSEGGLLEVESDFL
jgi:hypothetical protein